MLLLPAETLPEGAQWTYELKLDGYRALAVKTAGKVHLRSRNDKDFNAKYSGVTLALGALPEETVIDGEVVALDDNGRPSFNGLQNHGSATSPIYFYAFDVLILGGRNVMDKSLAVRRELLATAILPQLRDPIREAPRFDVKLSDLVNAVRAQGTGRNRSEAVGQSLRARCAIRRLAKDANQSGTGVGRRRIHEGRS